MREGWKQYALGDICTIVKGTSPTLKTAPGPYPLIVTAAQPSSSAEYQFDGEAVCIPMVSSTGHGHASLKRVHYASGKFAVANIIAAVQVKDASLVSTKFLSLYLQHFKDELIVTRMRGTANVSLSLAGLVTIPVELPPLEEQQRIVDLIGSLDDAIEAADSAADAAQDTAGELRAAHFGGARGDWESIESLADVIIGKQKNAKGDGQPPVPYLRAANLSGGRLDLSDISTMPFTVTERSRMGVEAGDVLIVEGGGGYGHSAMWPGTEHPFVGIQNSILRLRARSDKARPGYLLHWAKWARESGYFDDSMTSTTIPHLSLARVSAMTIPSTSVDEQERIVSLMDAAVDAANSFQNYAASARAVRSELLVTLLSGAHEIPATFDLKAQGAAA